MGREPQLSLGCDFHLSYENLQEFLVHPQKYTIEGGKYLLVEMSNFSIPVQMDEWFTTFASLGVTPILTHPERNPILQDDLQRVLRWIELGCAVQVTASALTGFWGEQVWRSAQWLLKHHAVHFLATDAHDTRNRIPMLSAARDEVAIVCDHDVAMALVEGNPGAVVEGKPLPYFPDPLTGK